MGRNPAEMVATVLPAAGISDTAVVSEIGGGNESPASFPGTGHPSPATKTATAGFFPVSAQAQSVVFVIDRSMSMGQPGPSTRPGGSCWPAWHGCPRTSAFR